MPLLVLPCLLESFDNAAPKARGVFPNLQGREQPWLCVKAPPGERPRHKAMLLMLLQCNGCCQAPFAQLTMPLL